MSGERFLVTGGNGRMAKVLREYLPGATYFEDYVEPWSSDYMYDDCSPLRLAELIEKHDTVIHLAACTDVDRCDEPFSAEEVAETNVGLTELIANTARRMIYVSTYYAHALSSEMGAYALSKRWGEIVTCNGEADHKILVVGYILDNFVDLVSRGLRKFDSLRTVQPVSYDTVCRIIANDLNEKPWNAYYDIASTDSVDMYTLGREIVGDAAETASIEYASPRPTKVHLSSDFGRISWHDELEKALIRQGKEKGNGHS